MLPLLYIPSIPTHLSLLDSVSQLLSQQAPRPPAGPVVRPSSPVQAAVDSKVASQVVQRLAASELKEAGFTGAQTEALYVLEMQVVNFVQSLYHRAHEYANLANRSGPIATDLLLATEEIDKEWAYEVSPEKLGKWLRKRQRREKKKKEKSLSAHAPSLIPPPSRSPSPELLSSDEEDEEMVDVTANVNPVPPPPPPQHLQLHPAPPPPPKPVKTIPGAALTLRNLATTFPHFPSLPPKHTYLQTPAPTTRTTTSTLPTLSKKLATASLVQESLRHLLLATEDAESGPGREDAELLGYIVNWEANATGRKRWRV
ncbi:hypothetical protein BT96DRAFT_605972 [Gymnopus androsaceus JB14]|uniref:Transcription initiation factor TFIID subunit 8 n=1 Tax=Gymnopus androsaceus JB14 TaxID=1447944 RepID=A0A6A4GIN1_9AGAR|nr:hypothetical protein BT96DRAFT_605972 [Gymnopus androsaceus JB14]